MIELVLSFFSQRRLLTRLCFQMNSDLDPHQDAVIRLTFRGERFS